MMFDSADVMLVDAGLFAVGFVCWTISTLSAGGGSILMIAAANTLLSGHAIAPIVTVTSMIAGPARMILFWDSIDWRVVSWYLPGAIAGAILGGWIFMQVSAQFVQVCMALFLISTVWQYRLGSRERSFTMRLRWFLPVSFGSGMTSAVVGASGLLANPFYLNYGLIKEQTVATRAVNSLVIQVAKIATYATLGALNWDLARHGASAGAGAVLAIWICRSWLRRLDSRRFRQFAIMAMLSSGVLILWHQRHWLQAQSMPG
jgi:uncharacterized membrane protein YfcA